MSVVGCSSYCLQRFLTRADRFSLLQTRAFLLPSSSFLCLQTLFCGWRWKINVNLTSDGKSFRRVSRRPEIPDVHHSRALVAFTSCEESESVQRAPRNKTFVRIFVAVKHNPCDGHTHTHTQKGTRNSVVFVLSELCLFKGGLVCEAEALNNN